MVWTSVFLAITATGFAACIGQILILRELLVIFYGNELSTGLILSGWLLWTAAGSGLAGRYSSRLKPSRSTIVAGLLLLAFLLPATVLWIRLSRMVWSIPLGELISPLFMLLIALSATLPFCIGSGSLFALTWGAYVGEARGERGKQPIIIYLGEAFGSALGGLFFYFVLLPKVAPLATSLLVSVVVSVIALILLGFGKNLTGSERALRIVGLFVCVLAIFGFVFGSPWERATRRWQWGPDFLAVRDTPYHNLVFLKDSNQYSLFGNGLWYFSVPDLMTTEFAVHLALLEHPMPQAVLVIGGSLSELAREILKYESVGRLDIVEPDPEVVAFLRDVLPASETASLRDERVRLYHQDARSFVRSASFKYDVVLSSIGDPINAELNRFYTVEFFQLIKKRLSPNGVFSFAVSSSDILGPLQVSFLKSIYRTVQTVFDDVIVIPGPEARFLVSAHSNFLVADPAAIVERLQDRGLQLKYVREYYLFDHLNPMRLNYLTAIIQAGAPTRINRDFSPTCYFNATLLWAWQLHEHSEKILLSLRNLERKWLWIGLAVLTVVMLSVMRLGKRGIVWSCPLNVMIVGAAQLIVEIVLLLSFQILEGFVYELLALIVALFMSGLALGAGFKALLPRRVVRARFWLIVVQVLFSIYILGILEALDYLHQSSLSSVVQSPLLSVPTVFSLFALLAGFLGGLHFALAVDVLAGPKTASGKTAGVLYAADLAGAAGGALLASLFLLPVYGLTTTMVLVALVCLGGAAALVF